MNKPSLTSLAASLALPLLLIGCGDTTGDLTGDNDDGSAMSSVPAMEEGEPETAEDLAELLRAEGLAANVTAQTYSQPFFSADGREIMIDGEAVQVFEYPDEDSAERDADQISDDGMTVGTTQVTWVGSPHFYQDGNLLVLYLGENETVLDTLDETLNGQFAGADEGMLDDAGTGAGL